MPSYSPGPAEFRGRVVACAAANSSKGNLTQRRVRRRTVLSTFGTAMAALTLPLSCNTCSLGLLTPMFGPRLPDGPFPVGTLQHRLDQRAAGSARSTIVQ